jgi:hypothetical protein
MRMTSYLARSRAWRTSSAVLDDVGAVAHLAEDAGGDFLVDDVVLGQEDAEGAALAEAGVDASGGAEQLVGHFFALEGGGEDAVQLLVVDRFGQGGDEAGREVLAVGGLLFERTEEDGRERWPPRAGGACPGRVSCPIDRGDLSSMRAAW